MKRRITTIGEALYWSYANLAMAHAAVSDGSKRCQARHYMIRARLYAGLNKATMNVGPLADDERLKMVLPQACAYCGNRDSLSVDHLVPTKRGGANVGENLVWACRTCNSSKGAMDVLEWLAERGAFPPLLLLRRYLKLAIDCIREMDLVEHPLEEVADLPFSISAVPLSYPAPNQLRLWVTSLDN